MGTTTRRRDLGVAFGRYRQIKKTLDECGPTKLRQQLELATTLALGDVVLLMGDSTIGNHGHEVCDGTGWSVTVDGVALCHFDMTKEEAVRVVEQLKTIRENWPR